VNAKIRNAPTTSRDGLIYQKGKPLLDVIAADDLARYHGFQHAEQLVRALSEGIPEIAQPGVFYWVETTDAAGIFGNVETFMIVAGIDREHATEAYDDWFGKVSDAVDIAKKLAKGETIE
jgi:hypothetical protein